MLLIICCIGPLVWFNNCGVFTLHPAFLPLFHTGYFRHLWHWTQSQSHAGFLKHCLQTPFWGEMAYAIRQLTSPRPPTSWCGSWLPSASRAWRNPPSGCSGSWGSLWLRGGGGPIWTSWNRLEWRQWTMVPPSQPSNYYLLTMHLVTQQL